MERLSEMLTVNLAPEARVCNETQVAWERPIDLPSYDQNNEVFGGISVTLADAESLLNEFVVIQRSRDERGIEDYRDLLDQYASLKN